VSEVTQTSITNTIRKLRFERNEMTQQDLAERVGVTRQTINAIELGKYSPSLEVAFRIAATLGVRLEEVFSYEGGGQPSPKDPR
jgi:putative transcriptional regulator